MKYIIKSNDNCDYILIKRTNDDGVLFELFYGTDTNWTNPGKFIGSLLDSGNDVSFKFEDTHKLKHLDYSTMEYVRILLEFSNRDSHKPLSYSVCSEEFTF